MTIAAVACSSPITGLFVQIWLASTASVCIPCRSLDRDRCVQGPVRHPARNRRRRPIRIGVAGSVSGLRYSGPRHLDSATEDFLWSVWCGAAAVPDFLVPYLIGRRQYVRTGSSASSLTLIVCGVPQGSVLGPILFLLYTADLILLIQLSVGSRVDLCY